MRRSSLNSSQSNQFELVPNVLLKSLYDIRYTLYVNVLFFIQIDQIAVQRPVQLELDKNVPMSFSLLENNKWQWPFVIGTHNEPWGSELWFNFSDLLLYKDS